MAARWFNKGVEEVMKGTINWTSDTIRIYAYPAFTINVDTQQFLSDLGSQAVGTGYTPTALTNKSIARDDTNDRIAYKADNVTWSITGTFAPQILVIVKWTGNAATSPLLGYDDKGTPQSRTNENFVVEFSGGNVLLGRNA